MAIATMPFDQSTSGTDLQTIMALILALTERLNRIETRLDRIIDAQHTPQQQNIPINSTQFTMAVLFGAVAVFAILAAIYYGGNAG